MSNLFRNHQSESCLPQIKYDDTQIRCSNFENTSEYVFFKYKILESTKYILAILFSNRLLIFSLVTVVFLIYVLYKSYWRPMLYVKELTDIGFDHIPKGRDRMVLINRSRQARKLGVKVPPPYPDGWFALLESQELKAGDVKAVNVLGENLCVYRTAAGRVHCVDAYCPHLGANLALGGRVRGDCIECPFHKWRFADGQCVAVPGVETVPKGVSIKTWTCVERDGAVWVWHHAAGAPPAWSVDEAPEMALWGYRGRNEFVVNSHVQDIPENGADLAHLNAVHSPSLLTNLGDKYPFLLNFVGQHTWRGEWLRGEDHTARMNLTHDYKIGKIAVFHIDVKALQLGPGHVRLHIHTALGPMLISQSVTPLGPLQQRVVHRVRSPWYNAPLAAAFLVGESHMFERDVRIWNHKTYAGAPSYVRADRSVRAFRAWYAQFYGERSVPFDEAARRPHGFDW